MAKLKKTCSAAVAVLGICAGVLAGAPSSAQAQDPVILKFQNADSEAYLDVDGRALTTVSDFGADWELKRPEGEPEGVYQIRWAESDVSKGCLEAVSKDEVRLEECVADETQRWKVDLRPDRYTTIESSQYPDRALDVYSYGVVLAAAQEHFPAQKWIVNAM